jgi:hypothetical protein
VPDVCAGGPVTGFDHHDADVEALMYRRAIEQALDPRCHAPGGVVHGGGGGTFGPYSIARPSRAQLERDRFAGELDRQSARADNVRAHIADQVAAAYGIPPALLGLVRQ